MENRRRGAGLVAWLALVLAIIALWLGWTAYNRTGGDLEQRIQRGLQQGAQNVEDTVPDDVDVDVQEDTNDSQDTTTDDPDATETQP